MRLYILASEGPYITMRDPPEGFYKRLNGSLQNPPIQCYLLSSFFKMNILEHSIIFYFLYSSISLVSSEFFRSSDTSIFMKSKERAGE